MSAFVVDNAHIDALVTFAIEKQISYYDHATHDRISIDKANATAIGKLLMDENVRSVNFRYHETDAVAYAFRKFPTSLTPVEAMKACDCLDYQSCETPDWEDTTAWHILQAIKSRAGMQIAGYDEAPWEINGTSKAKLRNAGLIRLC